MKVLLLVISGFCLVVEAQARIGENQTQMSTRYGVAREDRAVTNATATVKLNCTKTYDFEGWNLKTQFANGTAESIDYHRNDAKTVEPGEIEGILKAEAAGGRWKKLGEGLWSNSNGTGAELGYGSFWVTIKSAAVLQREEAERIRKAKPRTAPAF